MIEGKETPDFQKRKEYYTKKISEYLDEYPDNFSEFVGDEKIIEFGDKLLSSRLSTGYNFATFEQFPINSKESLIFYGVYAQRKEHFGELLARMEEKGIIEEDNVSFGVMGTKILGDYDDKEPVVREIVMKDGTVERTMESVEATATFHTLSKKQAEKIVIFLYKEAPKIKGWFVDPNIRATATKELIEVLVAKNTFKIARANVYRFFLGNIIALKKETAFGKKGWKAFNTPIDPELYEYLTEFGVNP